MPAFGFALIFLFIAIIEYYTFTALRFTLKSVRPSVRITINTLYILTSVSFILMFLFFPYLRTIEISKTLKNFIFGFSFALLGAKILISLVLLLDDLRRGLFYIFSFFSYNDIKDVKTSKGMSRSEFLNTVALLFGAGIFTTILYGMTNRYKYKVKKIPLKFDNLPSAFKGLKAIHISDIHSGSFNNINAVKKGVELINSLKADIVFFTGDLVNNKSSEMQDYFDVFKKIKAPMGVYSILGNHDYGDYIEWESKEAKEKNLDLLKQIHRNMDWHLLLDEHVVLENKNDKIALLGVQNVSFNHRFPTYGSLEKAYQGTADYPFKILLSHDPTHWDGEINTKYKDIDLTLSGHTHGFQFGVEIPGFRWSVAQYAYKQWAGLYQKENQFIYVNRGFGFLGYPGRVGILPEITLLEFT